jgi:hypothetical protein
MSALDCSWWLHFSDMDPVLVWMNLSFHSDEMPFVALASPDYPRSRLFDWSQTSISRRLPLPCREWTWPEFLRLGGFVATDWENPGQGRRCSRQDSPGMRVEESSRHSWSRFRTSRCGQVSTSSPVSKIEKLHEFLLEALPHGCPFFDLFYGPAPGLSSILRPVENQQLFNESDYLVGIAHHNQA